MLKPLVASIVVALSVLAGCSGNTTTTYEVLDRFHVVDSKDPNRAYFLWLKGTDGKAFDHYFSANEKAIWDSCWLGDKFYDLKVGMDYCERTDKSVMPTSLRNQPPSLIEEKP